MPKVSVQVGKRVRIDCDYEDYKAWEAILRKGLAEKFEEHTTKTDSGEYWKSIVFTIGQTEYKIGGPIMPIWIPDTNEPRVS